MQLTESIIEILNNADGKALGTITEEGVHVVPVSTIKLEGDRILLVNYFMNKTLENINKNPKVSLAFWRGLAGYQVKANTEYVTEGEAFNTIKEYVAGILPDRVVKGVLVLTPTAVYDVSATISQPGERIL